jgi:DGQHR domain-containing protein
MTLEKKKCDKCDVEYYISEDVPSKIEMEGIAVEQKSRKFYVVKAKAIDIDRLCRVPRIDFNEDNEKHAAQAINRGIISEWQRPLDDDRVASISNFFKNDNNFMVNAVVISLPEDVWEINELKDAYVNIEIDSTKWMRKKCECGYEDYKDTSEGKIYRWFDKCPYHECHTNGNDIRPGIIIDGQHRIRGTQGDQCGPAQRSEYMVATVLPKAQFPPSRQAKIFTEITTTAEDLQTSHKLYLLYKFGLAVPRLHMRIPLLSKQQPFDFREETTIGQNNRRAYQIACELCIRNSPWHDMISILESKRGDYIDMEYVVGLISSWFDPTEVFHQYAPDQLPIFSDKPVEELEAYLSAVKDTWSSVWSKVPRHRSSILQRRGIFYVVLVLFEDFAKKIDKRSAQRSLPEFKKDLKVLEKIDWGPSWKELETPDKNRRLLLDFLRHMIEKKEPKNPNAAIDSKPSEIELSSSSKKLSGKSLSSVLPITLGWQRPFHAYRKADIDIFQGDIKIYEEGTSDTKKTIRESDLPSLDKSSGAPTITITISYANHKGYSTETIQMKP